MEIFFVVGGTLQILILRVGIGIAFFGLYYYFIQTPLISRIHRQTSHLLYIVLRVNASLNP